MPNDWAEQIAKNIGADGKWARRINEGVLAYEAGDRSDGACTAVMVRVAYMTGLLWALNEVAQMAERS